MHETECHNCGGTATEDWYYKIDEKFLICSVCGYTYDKYAEYDEELGTPYREEISGGFGTVYLESKEGFCTRIFLDAKLTPGELKAYRNVFISCDQDKSYLMTYDVIDFYIHFGKPPEHFLHTFKEYKEKAPMEDQKELF
ncbi:hypothetical protein FZC84_17475 [Rossellomorea vietnamensis]|uniref:Uncharacterized protein n=1 Tax=Rossellomorea vietnamensis TaxID=218284 RepID=A0A5D4M8J0_9BACI|nr:hypothetical protein [Rossellomorea vietnamensis]TYR97808.1 hypothetical protein FZC84_17475 [Rossellomorea vietnamensis]